VMTLKCKIIIICLKVIHNLRAKSINIMFFFSIEVFYFRINFDELLNVDEVTQYRSNSTTYMVLVDTSILEIRGKVLQVLLKSSFTT